jgi:Tol biopolymer transport system component
MAHAAESGPRRSFSYPLRAVLVLLCAAVLGGCGSDGDSEGGGASSAESSSAASAADLPDGELVAFERAVPGAEERDLYVVGPEGGEPRLLRSPGDFPHWSADGGRLAFNACLNPPECTTAHAEIRRSTGKEQGFESSDPDLELHCPIWAPSGERLACDGYGTEDPALNGIYTVRAPDGRDVTRVTSNPGGEDAPLTWSPDGSQLLFSRKGSRGAALFIVPISGAQPRRITPYVVEEDSGAWSPDGRSIVFNANGTVNRMRPDGTDRSEIPLKMPDGSPARTAFDVSLSPDGHEIVFSLGPPSPGIYRAALEGGVVQLVAKGNLHHPNWGAAAPGS